MKSESPIKKPDTRRNVEELPSTYVAKVREPVPSIHGLGAGSSTEESRLS